MEYIKKPKRLWTKHGVVSQIITFMIYVFPFTEESVSEKEKNKAKK